MLFNAFQRCSMLAMFFPRFSTLFAFQCSSTLFNVFVSQIIQQGLPGL
jgi:hypothetical protein